MKRIIVLLLFAAFITACGTGKTNEEAAGQEEPVAIENLIEVAFNVEGMTCDGCENAIMKSIESLDGIQHVESSHEEGWTKVSYDGTSASEEDIKGKIADAGYTVTGVK